MRSGRCYARPTSARRTIARGSSFSPGGDYPTPSATRYGSSQNGKEKGHVRPSNGTPSLETWAKQWPTARAEDSEHCGGHRGAVDSLKSAVSRWPTPTSNDFKASGSRNTPTSSAHAGVSLTDAVRTGDSKGRGWATPLARDARGKGRTEDLNRGVQAWATPTGAMTCGFTRDEAKLEAQRARTHKGHDGNEILRQAGLLSRTTETDGPDTPPPVALNPCFVEGLMGLPLGWTGLTASVRSGTPSSQPRPEPPSSSFQLELF